MFILLLIALAFCEPSFFGMDEFAGEGCKGDKHLTEYSLLGECRHREDHSEKTVYHSYLQAEASFFADKDCTGTSRDYMIDLKCTHGEHSYERDMNMTYYTVPPKGALEHTFTKDSSCSKDFEGGMVFYPKAGACTHTSHRMHKVNSFMYTCNSTYVSYDFYYDPDCKSHSHVMTQKIGCNEDPEVKGLYVDVKCNQ